MGANVLYTVGHSTRPFDEFVGILKAHGVAALADVRRYPRSRKFPYFNDDELAATLPEVGLKYVPIKALGGRRRASADSVNTGWTSEGFRGYADYMQTPAFDAGLQELIAVALAAPTVIMCAEAVPWRCHRALIADAMLVRGWRVLDIMSETAAPAHELTAFARVAGTRITYPATGDQPRPRKNRKAKHDRAAGADDASLFE
jgi:uncharacterized protein (DUF488 family)